jgi:hypothetical protein
VQRLEHQLTALNKGDGWGELRGTPVGEAAIAWKEALGERGLCLARAEHVGLRERHQLRRQAARAGERAGPLQEAFEALAGDERARVRTELPEARKEPAELEGQYYGHLHFKIRHPEALRRLERLDREIAGAAWEMDVQRQDLDGIAPQAPEVPQLGGGFQRDARVLERSIELDRGFGIEL